MTSAPVDDGIVSLKPKHSNDYFLCSDVSDQEPFCGSMSLDVGRYFGFVGDHVGISRVICVPDRNRSG